MPIIITNLPYYTKNEADAIFVHQSGGDTILCSSPNTTGLIIKSSSSQAVDLFKVTDSDDNDLFTINANGIITNGTWRGSLIRAQYGGTGLGAYDRGDLIYYSYGDTFSRLPIAPTDYVLVSTGTSPKWTNSLILDEGLTVNFQSSVKFRDLAGDNYVAFKAPANVSTNVTWTLPATDGSAGQIIATDGNGNLSWASAAGLSSGAVTSGYLGNGSVVSGSIASGQIGRYHIADNSIFSGHISSNEIGNIHIASGGLGSGSIGSGQIGAIHLASGTLQGVSLTSGIVTSGYLGNNSVLSGNIASGQIGLYQLASGVLSNFNLSSGIITSGYIGNSAVVSGSIASGSIGAEHLASGVVQNFSLTSGIVTSGYIGNAAVVSGSIASGQIGKFHVGSGELVKGIVQGSNVSITVDSNDIYTISATISGGVAVNPLYFASGLILNSGSFFDGSVTMYAGIASGGIISELIANDAIISGKIASGTIGTYEISNNSIFSGNISSNQIGDIHIASGGLGSGSIGSGQIGFVHLASGTISTAILGSGQVTSGVLASGVVSQFNMASGAINSGHIASGAVVSDSIASGQVVSTKLASGSVASGQIGQFSIANINIISGTIANDKLTNSEINIAGSSTSLGGSWAAAALTTSSGLLAGTYYPSGSLTIGIASGGITSQMIADAAVSSGDIASGSISNFDLSSGAIVSGQIGNNSVVSGSVASGQIFTFHIASGGLLSGAIGSGQIGQNHLSSGTVNSGQLADNAVLSGSVASGQISVFHLASGVLQSAPATLQSGQVTSGYLGNGSVVSGSIASGQIGTNHFSSGAIAPTATTIDIKGTNASGLYPISFSSGIAGSNQTYVCSGFFYNPALRSLDLICYESGSVTGGIQMWPGTNGNSTIIGFNAGRSLTFANATVIGRNALGSGSAETNSTVIGDGAAQNAVGGDFNTIVGKFAGANNQGGYLATAIGDNASQNLGGSGAFGIVAVGAGAGSTNSGEFLPESVYIGRAAGNSLVGGVLASGSMSGGSCVYIGGYALRGTQARWNEIVIGGNTSGLGTNTLSIGRTDTASGIIYGNINFPYGIAFKSGGVTSGGIFTAVLGSGIVTSGTIASGQIGTNHFSSGAIAPTATTIDIKGTSTSGLYPITFCSGIGGSNQTYVCSGLFYNPALRSLDLICYLSGGNLGGVSIFPGHNGNATIIGQNAGMAANGVASLAQSVLIGRNAMASGAGNSESVVIGEEAAYEAISQSYNVIIGKQAGYSDRGGFHNVFIGEQAGKAGFGSGAFGNTAIGAGAGVASGERSTENIHIGRAAGNVHGGALYSSGSSGGSNIYLGAWTMRGAIGGPGDTSRWNEIVIGCNTSGLGTNTLSIGRTDTASGIIYGNINFPYGIAFKSGGVTSGGVFTAVLDYGIVTSGTIASGQISTEHFSSGAVINKANTIPTVGTNNASGLFQITFASGVAGNSTIYTCSGFFYNPSMRELVLNCPTSGGIERFAIWPGINGTQVGIGVGTSRYAGSSKNVFIGYYAGASGFIGNSQTFVGGEAGVNAINEFGVAADYATYIGASAGINAGCNWGTYVGTSAGKTLHGSYNTVVGAFAVAGGSGVQQFCTYIGGQTGGGTIRSGASYLTCIGAASYPAGVTNEIVIGTNTSGKGSNTIVLGNDLTVSGTIYGNIHFPYGLTVTTLSGLAQAGISSGGIITGTLASGIVQSGAIASGSVGVNGLGAGAWSNGKFLSQDGAGSLIWSTVSSVLTSGSVQSGMIGNNAVVSGSIASGQISRYHIANSSIFSGHISSSEVGSVHLASGTIFTVNNSSDNRVLTSIDARTANAESNFTYDGNTLDINSTASGNLTLNIDGVSGTIFSVTDSTVGDLLLVGTISGNPIFTVNSAGYTKTLSSAFAGQATTFNVYQFADTSGAAAFYDYYVLDTGTSAYRAGSIFAVWNATANTIEYNELATNDLGGPTSGLAFSLAISSNNVVLSANISAGTWTGKVATRII